MTYQSNGESILGITTDMFLRIELQMRFIFLLVAFLTATSAWSENFGNFFTVKDNSLIVLSGNLTMRSTTNFKNALASQQNTRAVVLESGGGTVASALQIAKIVQKEGLITYVPEGSYSASACSIIFFSGKQRFAEGKLGVHQMSSTGPLNLSGFQFLLADVMSAFDSFDVDDRVMQVMLRTPPEEVDIAFAKHLWLLCGLFGHPFRGPNIKLFAKPPATTRTPSILLFSRGSPVLKRQPQ